MGKVKDIKNSVLCQERVICLCGVFFSVVGDFFTAEKRLQVMNQNCHQTLVFKPQWLMRSHDLMFYIYYLTGFSSFPAVLH